jgi:hypothetical protein
VVVDRLPAYLSRGPVSDLGVVAVREDPRVWDRHVSEVCWPVDVPSPLSFSFRCVYAICSARCRRSAGLRGRGFSGRGSWMASAEGGQPRDLGASRCVRGFVISPVLLCTPYRLSFRPFPCPSVLRMAGEAVDEHYTSRRQPWAPLQARHKSMRPRQQSEDTHSIVGCGASYSTVKPFS